MSAFIFVFITSYYICCSGSVWHTSMKTVKTFKVTVPNNPQVITNWNLFDFISLCQEGNGKINAPDTVESDVH